MSHLAKKVLISDKIKTHCDQRANMAAVLQRLLNFLCCRPSLPLQNCSSVVTNNDMGVCAACLQFYAPLVLVLPSEEAWTTHPALTEKTGDIQPRHPQPNSQNILSVSYKLKPNDHNSLFIVFLFVFFLFSNVGKVSLDFSISASLQALIQLFDM